MILCTPKILTFISRPFCTQLVDSMSYGIDLSPAQAPLNCFGPSLSTRIFSRLRPRHARKTEYNNRLRDGDAQMMEAREVFQACQNVLGHDARATIHVNLEGSVSVRLQFNKETT